MPIELQGYPSRREGGNQSLDQNAPRTGIDVCEGIRSETQEHTREQRAYNHVEIHFVEVAVI